MYRDTLGRFSSAPPRDWPVEVAEPIRAPSVAADVLVPVAQAMAYALASIVAGLVLCSLLELPLWYALCAGGLVFALAVPGRMHGIGDTIWRTQQPVLPEAPPPAQTVRLELTEETPSGGVKRMRIADVPVDDERLRQFVQAALQGESLSVHRWVGAGRPFTRSQYVQLADALEQAGFITAARGNQGRRLTERGRRVLPKLLR